MARIIPEQEEQAGLGSGVDNGTQTSFVYKPGGVAGDNVYNSWASLFTDLQQVSGPKIIQIDDSIISPAIIPSGMYNLKDTSIIGNSEVKDLYPVVQFDEGCIFTALEELKYLEIIGNSTSASFSIDSARQLILENTIISVLPGKYPIFESSSTFDVILKETTLGGSEVIFKIDSGTTNFFLKEQSTITSDVIESSIVSVVDFEIVDPNTNISSQSGILGSTNINLLSDASLIFYDNTGSGLVADSIQSAISELAGASIGATSNLSFSRNIPVPNSGTLYLSFNEVVTSSAGIPILENISLVAGGIVVDNPDLSSSYNLQFLINNLVAETVPLPSGNNFASNNLFTSSVSPGDIISARLIKTVGSGKSEFSNINAILIYKKI